MLKEENTQMRRYSSPEATLVELAADSYFLVSGFEENAEIDDHSGESWWDN